MSFMKPQGTPMCETVVIREGDALRGLAETFVRNVYAAQYGAQLEGFPSRIFAVLNDQDEIVCAAGVRLQDDGFFSERYLDSPIEQVLGIASKRAIARGEIFEVTTLASLAPRATASFIEAVGAFGESKGFVWSFFTLTRRLHRLVERLGHPLTHLADADHRRIPDHERWGTYYASEPKVFAIASPRLALDHGDRQGTGSLYAEAV
jgi:Thermostable hemolysin